MLSYSRVGILAQSIMLNFVYGYLCVTNELVIDLRHNRNLPLRIIINGTEVEMAECCRFLCVTLSGSKLPS